MEFFNYRTLFLPYETPLPPRAFVVVNSFVDRAIRKRVNCRMHLTAIETKQRGIQKRRYKEFIQRNRKASGKKVGALLDSWWQDNEDKFPERFQKSDPRSHGSRARFPS